MTWWFRAAALAAITALIYIFFRYRMEQNLKVFNIRNHIANDLHDEIGSTLSSVYIYSEVVQGTIEDIKPQTHSYLKQISADTGNMIDALSDIVWTVNAKNDRFENIINRMRAAAVELFEAKGYNLHLQFTEQLHKLKLGMAYRKNFYLLYKEAINNAAKYADGKNIWILLTYTEPYIRLCIRDDGRGFDFSTKHAGNGLASMQKRAEELNGTFEIISSREAGTEVLLVFPI